MIDTLALAVVLTSNSGGVCKMFLPPKPTVANPVVSFRGVGPKHLAVTVSETLSSYGFGSAIPSDAISMSLRSPISQGKVSVRHSKPALGLFEAKFLNQTLDRPVASDLTATCRPPVIPAGVSAGHVLPVVTGTESLLIQSLAATQAASPITTPIAPKLPKIENQEPTSQAANKFYEPQPLAPMEKRVTVSLSATPLETVVGLLSKQTGINIVLISKPDQKVTLNIKDMPLSEAMKHISALSGVRTLKVRNTLVMAEDSVLKAAYPTEYAAESAEKATPSGSTSTTTNSASGNTTQPNLDPSATAKGEDIFKVVTLKHLGATPIVAALKEAVSKLGVTITALPNSLVPRLNGGANAASGAAAVPTADQNADNSRTLLISGPAKAVAQVEAIISATDVARRQVQITVTIHDVSDSAMNEQGIEWAPGQFNVTEATNLSPNLGTFQRTGVSFTATMKALEKNDKARLLSSPNVNVMDGESSSILIGERRQFPIVASFNANGQPVFSIQESKIGIQLDVSAQITSDGSITLAVRPEVSSIIEFLNINGGSYPQIATRSSENRLTMKDGDTMVIGGLVKEEDIKNYQRMPLLSNIPFFGELFKSRRIEKRKSQLIISITPNIIKQ